MKSITTDVSIAASRERVLEAFLNVEDLREWWHVERGLIESNNGGIWALSWQGPVMSAGTIGSLREHEFLHINNLVYFHPEYGVFGPMQLTISVSQSGNETALTVRQDGYADGPDWARLYEGMKENWSQALKALKQYLET